MVFLNKVFQKTLQSFNQEIKEVENFKCFKPQKTSGGEEPLSLNDILKCRETNRDHIYEMLDEGERFRFVSVKVKAVEDATYMSGNISSKNETFLVQVIDLSHKMFYTEIKERESILQMINATVSHELRNPLNAIIDQKNLIFNFLILLSKMILSLRAYTIYSDLCNKLQKLHDQLLESTSKIGSASKFIDFFVHDMLDYAVLQKTTSGFIKQNECFNVREAIEEMIEILRGKIKLKKLEIVN